jgi:hypothetical protein
VAATENRIMRRRARGFLTSAKTIRRLESVWETGLFVFIAYRSHYIASAEGILFDELFLLGAVISSVILNLIARRSRKVRGSGNRWVTFSNHSIIWFFGVFFGALSDGLPTLVALISQYPELIIVAGFFLLFVFLTIDLNKETGELVKPKSKPD